MLEKMSDNRPRLVAGQKYSRAIVRKLVGLDDNRGGPWYTGYVQHNGEWFLFPNVGTAGRTGHDYGNQWEGGRLWWYGKTNTTLGQPAMRSMLTPGAMVHLFTREADRDPYEYHGLVRAAKIENTTPVKVLWEIVPAPPGEAVLPEEIENPALYPEGTVRTITVDARERSRAARAACVAHWGTNCQACGIALRDVYGPLAEGLIHVHHVEPLRLRDGAYRVDPVADLRPVCPNCHAVIHLQSPPLTVDQVRALHAQHARP